MLVLVWRAQACGLEGKDKPDKRIWVGFVGWNADLWLIITWYIWSVATFAGDSRSCFHPIEWTIHQKVDLSSQFLAQALFWYFYYCRNSRDRFEPLLFE